ncbi:MAG TPA: class I SAM-dependent methyltransferase [Candidatus Saccharibacteria bacterium]|nr:class I SAM-dependent methyltransferase [Candidatus Saccharibacteria bacterium]
MSQYSNFRVDLKNNNSTWTKVFNMIKSDTVILDIGCSSGYFDNELVTKKNCTVDGFELDKSDAEKASKVCRKVTNENIEEYIFNNDDHGKYDYILFLDVLEHLIDPVKTLQKCKKILKKNGEIIFSIPNMAHASIRLELLNGSFKYEDEGLLDRTHLHFYEKRTIQELVYSAGYKFTSSESVIRDISPKVIDDLLKSVGLMPTNKFYDYLSNEEAMTYQYVCKISPSTSKRKAPKVDNKFKPVNLYEEQVVELKKEIEKIHKYYLESEKQRQILLDENTKIKNMIKKIDILRLHKVIKKLKSKNG